MSGSQEPWDHPRQGTCTRQDLAERLRALGFSHREAAGLVTALLELMREGLGDEGSLKLAGFGTLSVVDRSPRQGRDLKTGEALAVPGRRTVAFRPSHHLRERLDAALGEQETGP